MTPAIIALLETIATAALPLVLRCVQGLVAGKGERIARDILAAAYSLTWVGASGSLEEHAAWSFDRSAAFMAERARRNSNA